VCIVFLFCTFGPFLPFLHVGLSVFLSLYDVHGP
jgi:hypothetical protein